MDQLILIIYLVLIAAPISTFLHELGHLFGAILASAEKVVLRIGTGNKIIAKKIGNIELIIYGVYFVGGMTKSERYTPYNKKEKLCITVLGPVANALTALISYIILKIYPNHFIFLFLMFNLWMTVGNLIPFKWREKQTDGYTILQILKNQ